MAWLAVAAALVLAGIPLVHWFRRRRKLHDAREPRALILATYDVFSERAADLGFGRGLGETPLEYGRRVEATELLVDGQLERLTGTVVRVGASHVVVACKGPRGGTFVERYGRRDGLREGGGRAQLINPDVDHPRWSQAKERRIGEVLRRKTLPFNGYADQVASLYAGMDLRRNF